MGFLYSYGNSLFLARHLWLHNKVQDFFIQADTVYNRFLFFITIIIIIIIYGYGNSSCFSITEWYKNNKVKELLNSCKSFCFMEV